VVPQATAEKDIGENFPLHLACKYNQSENVILA
jgi:hypothetical protein